MENVVQKYIPTESRPKLYFILVNISLVLFFYSVWQIKPVVVDINDFLGLTSHLTIVYWIGLALITLCSILVYLDEGLKNDWMFLLILIVVGLFLFGLGVFAEENTRFPCSYYPAGEVKTVLATHHIDTISWHPLISYRCWPAFHLISASILHITGIELSSLIKYLPLFWIVCVIFITFVIGTHFKFSSNQSFLASFLFLSSFWLPQYYYSPQSFAFIIYLLLFLFLVSFERIKGHFKGTLLIMSTFSMLVITHLVTSIIVILSFFIQSVYKRKIQFLILFSILLIAWYIYLAPVMFRFGVLEFKNQAMNLDFLLFTETTKFTPPSEISGFVNNFRLSYLGIYAVYGVIAIILYLTGKIKKENKDRFKISFCWLIGGSSIILINYGVEQFGRAYIFCLVPAICILILSFSNRKILVTLMILLIVLHIPAHYGSESFDQTLTTELKGAEFLALKVHPQQLYYLDVPYIWHYSPDLVVIPFTHLKYWSRDILDTSELDGIEYIYSTKRNDNRMKYCYNFNPLQDYICEVEDNYNLIYDNRNFKLYKYIQPGR